MSHKSKIVPIEQHNIGRADTFYTTPLFWDCLCEENYIHACTENVCMICKSECNDAPDSHVNEVFRYSTRLDKRPVAALDALCSDVCPELVPILF